MDSERSAAVGVAAGAPRPVLRMREGFAIVVGIVVGAGIFRTPSLVAGTAGSEAVFMAAWLIGGLLSLVGALCYAELATTYPQAGGDYAYLRRAFGARLAFLFAWARLTVIQTGSIVLLSFVVGDYLADLFALGPWASPACAAAVVLVLTAINWLGVRQGATTQNWLTVAEICGLLLIIAVGLMLTPSAAPTPLPLDAERAYGLVLVFVLLTYGGWSEAVYVTAEMRDARRVMPRILAGGLALVAVLYLLVNYAYLRVLGLGGIAGSDAVAADFMRATLGMPGVVAISAFVAIAALTSANATLITGARSAFAVGRDFPALAPLGRWHAASGSPRTAIVVQGALSLALIALGAFARDGFRTAVEYTAPVFWLFLLLVGVALFVLRARDPRRERPFRVPLYPLLPLLFCATSAYLLYSSLAYTGIGALVGVAVLAVGGLLLLRLRPAVPPDEEPPP